MKAVRLHKFHSAPVIDEVPEPTITHPLDVIVKIGGAGVCRTDLHIIEGQWDSRDGHPAAVHPRPRERRLGARGRLGRHQRRGRRHRHPAPDPDLRPVPRLPGRRRHALREQHLPRPVHRRRDGRVPAHLRPRLRQARPQDPPADVAALADAGITAYHAVRKALPLLYPGTTAVVIGAGGLGHIGVQCLAALSATSIIVVDRNPEALKLAEQLGADHTVVADGKHVDAVKDLTGGNGAHVVLDFVAEQGAEMDAWNMTAPGGSDFVIGYGGTITIPTLDIISTERNIIGNIVGTYNELAELMALAQAGKVTLHTKAYPLTAAPDALADLDAGRVRGRAILVP